MMPATEMLGSNQFWTTKKEKLQPISSIPEMICEAEKRTRHKEDKTLAAPGDRMASHFEGTIQHQ